MGEFAPKWVGEFIRNRQIANHDEVLFFSKLLDRSVAFLLDSYRLGTNGMTEREKNLHRKIQLRDCER